MPRGVRQKPKVVEEKETATEMFMKQQIGGVVIDKLSSSVSLTSDDIRTPEGLLLLQCWTRDGLTLQQIADKLSISVGLLCKWRERYPEVLDAFRRGKELVDYEVESALLKCALGYKKKKTVTYIGKLAKNGSRDVGSEQIIEEVGPNVTACLAWLNNRNSKKWQRNRDDSLTLDDKAQGITINIVKGDAADEIKASVNDSKSNAEVTVNKNDDWGDN